MMNKITSLLEKFLMPIASKMSTQRHLMSLKDAFIATLPVSLTGSMAVLFNVFLRDIPVAIWGAENAFTTNDFVAGLIAINGQVWWASLAIMSLLFAFALGYNLVKNAGHNPLAGGIVALSVFIATMPQSMITAEGESFWGVIQSGYMGATGLFTAIIMIIIAMEIYVWFLNKKITIKLPEQVPSNVSTAFTAFIPAMAAIFFSAFVAVVVWAISGSSINDLISEYLMMPLLNLSQGYLAVMTITFFTQLLWFFGIHGMQVLSAVYESIWGVAQIQNIDAFMQGLAIPYQWVRASFDLYGHFGGAGATIGLVIAMFVFGRNADTKAMRAVSVAPSVFNINEPIIFGVPIILNPIYIIPWIFVPMICISVGYFATMIGFADPVVVAIPWVTPVILSSFLATAGSIGAVITQVICLAIAIFIWAVFLIIAEKQANRAYNGE